MRIEMVIIAHNIRSAYNIGAIFRTADGMGAFKVYLTGYSPCPHPLRGSVAGGPLRKPIYTKPHEKMIAKTALGAENNLAWEKRARLAPLLKELKSQKFHIVALEQNKKSLDYRKYKTRFPLALMIGSEPKGIDPRILKKCDAVIEIPMRGKKNSLNVAVALGVAGYELMR